MSKNTYIIMGVAVLLAAGGFFFLQDGNAPQPPVSQEEVSVPSSVEKIVTYTDSGYSPREVMIEKGDTVVFKNESAQEMWPATAIHPTHTIYPGSDITKCATPEGRGAFDACGPVAPGGSWLFQFEEVGTWGFHDHLNVSHTGRIIVQ